MSVSSKARKYEDEIIRLYLEEKITSCKLAKKFECGESTILRILNEHGIERRHLGEACKKYKMDFTYFDEIDTPNKAYILGFLYADGVNYKD